MREQNKKTNRTITLLICIVVVLVAIVGVFIGMVLASPGTKTSQDSSASVRSSAKSSSKKGSSSTSSSASSGVDKSDPNYVFDNVLSQTQQLALLAAWSNPQPTGHYQVYLGNSGGVFYMYDSGEGAGDWPEHTFKFVDNQDGSFTDYYADSDLPEYQQDMSNITWTPYKNITKAELQQQYGDQMNSYVSKIDLSTRLKSNPEDD